MENTPGGRRVAASPNLCSNIEAGGSNLQMQPTTRGVQQRVGRNAGWGGDDLHKKMERRSAPTNVPIRDAVARRTPKLERRK